MNSSIVKNSLLSIFELVAFIIFTHTGTTCGSTMALPMNIDTLTFANTDEPFFISECFNIIASAFVASRRQNFDQNMIFYAQKMFIEKTSKIIVISDIHADSETLSLLVN